MKNPIKIAPSLLSADFSCLKDEIRRLEDAGADMLHIDVMDGHFVPNITMGPAIVDCLNRITRLPLDVHLMIEHPEKIVEAFIEAGSDAVTFHIETLDTGEFFKQAQRLKKRKIKAGISLNPDTPLSCVQPVLEEAELVLVMSVDPGFSGQKFIPGVLAKIRQLRRVYKKDIAIDGGINVVTAKGAAGAGANILAAGSYIFGAKDIRLAISRLRSAAASAVEPSPAG